MMGLSSPIKACSSRLGSRAQSVEMDSSQEVLGLWFPLPQQVNHACSCRRTCCRNSELMLFFSFVCGMYRCRPFLRIPFLWYFRLSLEYYKSIFGHAAVSLMIIIQLRWKNKGISWINDRFHNVTWFMGSALINGHFTLRVTIEK